MTNAPRINVAVPYFSGTEKVYLNEAFDSTWISSKGSFIDRFEQKIAEMAGSKYAVVCNNGTTSLHLGLIALGLNPGDEVIMPALTYVATANCVRYCGGIPVFVDNNPRTFNIDPEKIEAAITPKTKGIMVVHLYGQSAEMAPIMEIAQRHGLWILEDAAEAHGAKYRGEPVGSFGACASFSFFGNKIVTSGEGGAVTTSDPDIYERMKLFRNQGMDPNRRYWHSVVGYNYRMTNLTAAVGLAQIERLTTALDNRRQLAQKYCELLKPIADVGKILLPMTADDCLHSFWMYTILVNSDIENKRDSVMSMMDADGIETRPVFYPVNEMPPYYQPDLHVPNAAYSSSRGINLPTHEHLTDSDLERVVDSLDRALD